MAVIRFDNNYFTPDDDVKTLLDALPNRAVKSMDIEAYGFTDMRLVNNLIAAAGRGVKIRIMNDRSQAGGPSDKKALETLSPVAGVTIKVVESEKGAIDHLKQIIIDGEDGALADSSIVATGSYNFSGNGDKDGAQAQDNYFRLTNDPGLVDQAMKKFEHDWQFNIQKPEWQVQQSQPAPSADTAPSKGQV